MNQVFFQRVAAEKDTAALQNFVLGILKKQLAIATPILVATMIHAPWVFGFALGEQWTEAGSYAALLSIAGFVLFLTSWLDRVYDVKGRQRLALTLETTYNVVSLGALIAAMATLPSTFWALAVYVGVAVAYNVIWLGVTFKLAGFSLNGLPGVAGTFAAMAATSWLALFVATTVLGRSFGLVSFLLVIGLLWLYLFKSYVPWRSSP